MPKEQHVYYSKSYLEDEIKSLAEHQIIAADGDVSKPIDPILHQARSVLTATYKELAKAAKRGRKLTSAGEWLLDNFYIIQEQIVQLKEDIPPAYYKKLPRLKNGDFAGYPRIYAMVERLAAISDNIIDKSNTTRTIQAFQEVHTLKLGELWAIPIMIKLILIQRLVEKSKQLLDYREIRDRIDDFLEDFQSGEEIDPGQLIDELPAFTGDESAEFVTILAQRMQASGLLTESERDWFDYRFQRWNTTLDDQLHIEAHRTSRMHLSIQNAVSTLREISETDWSDFVEDCSVVERILRLDPQGTYPAMDFNTRDRYRKIVERLSEHSDYSEPDVAQQTLLLAEEAEREETVRDGNKAHVGYYLIDEGRKRLAKRIAYEEPFGDRLRKMIYEHPKVYFTFIGLHSLVLLAIIAILTGLVQASGWLMALTLAVSFFPALELAMVSTNRFLSLWLPPRILPKLDMKAKIPEDYRTMVVVPSMFSSPNDVRNQFEALEIRSLANPDPGLQFIMLSDFKDSDKESMPGDEAILQAAKKEVVQLNERYESSFGNRFFLLHRKRLWNEKEQKWMGWERKRGKLEEFNRVLRDTSAKNTFITITNEFIETLQLKDIQYIITLDADTQLPPGSAKDLIRTAAHPLNHPQFNASGSIVEKGYGIVQPRISIPPKAANQTWFSNIYSGNVGLDIYTTAVSDIYQDLFGEGIYTGKGIYHLSAFHELLDDYFPENTILSHDLLESAYLRSSLATDIELFDDFPSTYLNYSSRNHRWIRGDWQILLWLIPYVPVKGEGWRKNPISFLSKWKIFDNLRRSLTAFFLLVMLIFGWTLLPGSPLIWTFAVLGIAAFPIYSSFTTEIFSRPRRVRWKLYFEKIRSNVRINTLQAVSNFMFLPHQAYLSMDAIVRTLWRMLLSDKKRLEWTTSSQLEVSKSTDLWFHYKEMWINIVWALFCIALVWSGHPQALYLSLLFGLSWVVAPYFAFKSSTSSPETKEQPLSEQDELLLRSYARRTWHFFEQFVNEQHAWLPPDNYQETPFVGSVGRTSPTNIGMYLSSVYVAYKLGYITLTELLNRLKNSLHSMQSLERYSGHFYNWYSTSLGEVLHPRYISTVDSGNLAANLILIKQALTETRNDPWPNPSVWEGMKDTFRVLIELIKSKFSFSGTPDESNTKALDICTACIQLLNKPFPEDLAEYEQALRDLNSHAEVLASFDLTPIQSQMSDALLDQLTDWFQRPKRLIGNQLLELHQWQRNKGSIHPPATVNDLLNHPSFNHLDKRIENLIRLCDEMVEVMDFSLLYYEDRNLFSIGYNVDRAQLDEGTYDLLASEARLTSFIAVAKGEVPPVHWFRMSRRLTSIEHNEILLSWGGTMFEYLMPLIYLRDFEKTLLSNTYDKVVEWQKKYGESRHWPWGFSESGYSMLNLELHYQYRAFGAPGLGLRRGLAEHYVVAPYASMLALMVHPVSALENLKSLQKEGAYGLSGFYESIDYTPETRKESEAHRIVSMYMAHHQGMSMLSLLNVLDDNYVQKLFHKEPLIQSCELLLQERIPRGIPVKEPRPIDVELEPREEKETSQVVDHAGKDALDDSPPRTHLLSNGEFSLVWTHAGTGFASWNELTLTRWRRERVKDAWGFFFYVRDLHSNNFWSSNYRPVNKVADRYDSWFHAGKVQTARVDDWIETFTEICVSPEDNIELRKITLTNYSDRIRSLELTSYAEVVLNDQETDVAHPAFSNLFIQTEHLPEYHALLAKRRAREKGEDPVWLVHTLASDDLDTISKPVEYETDRKQFIGRGRSLDDPAAMDPGKRLSGTIGNVPDPIVSQRISIELKPGEKKSVTFGIGLHFSREEAVRMADQYDNPYSIDRAFELASIYGSVELDHIGLEGEWAHYFQKMAGALIYGNEQLRTDENKLKKNRKQQADLWRFGISGDLPIVLFRIGVTEDLPVIDRLLKAHAFWRLKGLKTDLVILNDHPPSYIDELQEEINHRIQSSLDRQLLNQRGGIFILRSDNMTADDIILVESVAAVSLEENLPKLDFQTPAERSAKTDEHPRFKKIELGDLEEGQEPGGYQDLLFYNGYGGFTSDGNEYVIQLPVNEQGTQIKFPPSPWINVIANKEFGFIASERGSDYTWSLNSRENRLTPWSNDAVIDPIGEALYIRSEEEGIYWSPTPGPTPGSTLYEVRHGFGYTSYFCRTMNIDQEVTKWVSWDDSIKLVRIRLSNTDLKPQTVSLYHYLEWVLGVHRGQSSRFVVTEFESDIRTIFAQNRYNNEFSDRVAFATFYTEFNSLEQSYTSDRTWFIGKNRGVTNPRALTEEEHLNGRFGAGFDPCAVSQIKVQLESGKETEIFFMLGEADSFESARKMVKAYQDKQRLDDSLQTVRENWRQLLHRIQISSPAKELDLLFNGWLQYQNIACRLWGRTGFYQSGGAFGFRDQLQDVTAAVYLDPKLAREQIIRHAAHQFVEGDVLHWWHPPSGRGVRTKITDDLLWLPYVTSHYIETTGDQSILDQEVAFIKGRSLEEGEHEAYLNPESSDVTGSIFEHCCRAIDRSLTKGSHGLPLMGTGDWNDGLNRVGEHGKGESVWLGFFIYAILSDFIPLCRRYEEVERVRRYEEYLKELKVHLNDEGWDGSWYRRAFYDDGSPLGSSKNDECKIDAIAQAWSIISGVATKEKAVKALEAAGNHLISEEERIIRLLTPPFDQTDQNPGYIKGYIPGVRENGGQYTHAALWLIKAFADMGFGKKATHLLRMINPIMQAETPELANRYKVEPYAVPADIYGAPPLIGMGGWTWYTGSAAWMYRVMLESILGFKTCDGDTIRIQPTISSDWNKYSLIYTEEDRSTIYQIDVLNKEGLERGKATGTMDGNMLDTKDDAVLFRLKHDGKKHKITIFISESSQG